MPLLHGSSREIISQNISELRRSGKKESQAVAIAMKYAKKNEKKLVKKVVSKNTKKPYGST